MLVQDIMTRDVVTLTMDDDLSVARDLFDRYRFRHLPVIDDDGTLAGIVSDRDMLAHLSPFVGTINERTADANSLRKKAHQIMTRLPRIARRDERVEQCALIMLHHKVSCLPVVNARDELIGMVTTRDVLWACLRDMGVEQEPQPDAPAA
ncbi:MAG: CBS domain-containing protein [Planctomycetota bacterium]